MQRRIMIASDVSESGILMVLAFALTIPVVDSWAQYLLAPGDQEPVVAVVRRREQFAPIRARASASLLRRRRSSLGVSANRPPVPCTLR